MNSHTTTLGRIMVMLALCSIYPVTGNAQTVWNLAAENECMSAQPSLALKICKSLLDNGSRNADVYWKLSSAQYQNGQVKQANETLDAALRLYPGDAKLGALKDILTNDTNEQALIARSAKLNQNSLDKGALKIACLTKTGKVGISACKRRLQLSGQDGARMRARLAELEQTLDAARVATAPVAPNPVQPIDEPQAPPALPPLAQSPSIEDHQLIPPVAVTEPDEQQLIAEARREAYKVMVSEVQTRLNEFGFNAGYPDGIPGSNTRTALAEFYAAVGSPVTTSITDLTIEDLDNEKLKLSRAEKLAKESQSALSTGDLTLADNKLKEAKRMSGLLKVPGELERALPSSPLAKAPADQPPALVPTPVPVPVPEPVQPALAGNGPSQRFSELIGQINTLHGQIRRQQANELQQMDALRSALR